MTDQAIILELFMITTIGKISAISTSKIRKIMATRKNWRENGSREEDFGSNPHSKGDLFSRSIIVFFDKIVANTITIIEINIINEPIKIRDNITYTMIL